MKLGVGGALEGHCDGGLGTRRACGEGQRWKGEDVLMLQSVSVLTVVLCSSVSSYECTVLVQGDLKKPTMRN